MINVQLSKRISSDAALAEYETILTENGIMAKHNMAFANHTILKGESIPKHIDKSIDSIKIADVLLNNKTLGLESTVSVEVSILSSFGYIVIIILFSLLILFSFV
jgi:hypothetical protein